MEWNGGVATEAKQPVPAGTYDAMPTEITEEEGKYGTMIRIEFLIFTNNTFNEHKVSGLCSPNITPESKWGRWITAITGQPVQPGTHYAPNQLLNRDCRIVVENTTSDSGRVFDNVKDVLPSRQRLTQEKIGPF
jgi:hypothetical protein